MIAVLSDSHIPSRAEEIPEKFWDKIEQAEIVVHAGDYAREETFNALEEYSNKFYGVKGNCDFFKTDNLEESHTFEYEGLNFGVYHGTGISPRGHTPTLEKIAVKDLEVDILINGHTHKPEIKNTGNALLLNPGSCTGVGGGSARPSRPSMMTLTFTEKNVSVKLVELEDGDLICTDENQFLITSIVGS